MGIWYVDSESHEDLTIRPMESNDVKEVMSMDPAAIINKTKKQFTAENQFGIVAQKDKELIGYLSFSYLAKSWKIHRMLVKETHRRKGIATAMLLKLCKALDEHTPRIFTYVGESNLAGQCFLKKIGFKAVKDLNGKYSRLEMMKEIGEPSYLMVYSFTDVNK